MNEQTKKMTQLQLKRDFLKQYVKQFESELKEFALPIAPSFSDENLDNHIKFLQEQIDVYIMCLKSTKVMP